MTIYFAGGEDTSFSINTGSAYYTPALNNGTWRTNYARGSLSMYGAYPITVPPVGPKLRLPTASLLDFWVHFWFLAGDVNVSAGLQFISIGNGSGAVIQGEQTLVRNTIENSGGTVTGLTYTIEISADVGRLSLATWNPPSIETVGTVTGDVPGYWGTVATAADLFQSNVLYACDMHYDAGSVSLYFNETEVLTGVVAVGAQSFVEILAATNNVRATYFSEFLVADQPTFGQDVYTLVPSANGNTNTWSGTVSNISEWQINDSTYNSTTADAALAQYAVTYNLPSGAYTVDALVIEARLAVGGSGPQTFEFSMRTTDGTDHVQSPTAEPTSYFDNYSSIIPSNPETGQGWVVADFGSGFNLGVVSGA